MGLIHTLFAVVASVMTLVLTASCGRPLDRYCDWIETSFAGADAPSWSILQALAADAQQRHLPAVRVSHSIHLWAHAFKFHPLDPRYRVGMEFDLVLRDDFGLPNAAKCPEGVCRNADYVVEQQDLLARFPPQLGPKYELLAENREYRLYRRKSP